MEIEEAIPIFCAADETLNGLIAGRIYYDELPSTGFTLPAVVYSRISTARDHVVDTRSPRFQFTAWAATRPAAGAVEAAIEDAFIRYKGRASGIAIIQGVIEVAGYDMPAETDEYGARYGRACDVVIHYRTDI